MERVKAKIDGMKQKIDEAEERETQAKHALKDREEKLKKTEEDGKSYLSRICLLKAESEKVATQLQEKEKLLGIAEGNLNQTHFDRRRLEDLEIEGDETIDKLQNRFQECWRKKEEAEGLCENFERRLALAEHEYRKVVKKCEEKEKYMYDLESTYETISTQLKKLEQRDLEATDREDEMEDKAKYLEALIKERMHQLEECERKIVTLERLRDDREDERIKFREKLEVVLEERRKIESMADEL